MRGLPAPVLLALLMATAAGTFLLAAPAPTYDPWAWLLWGREIAGLELSTHEGPAFKPLPVAVAALLTPAGSAAPWLWVLIARAGAVAALVLVFRSACRLAGGSRAAGTLAALGTLATGAFAGYAASGMSEGLLLALALGAAEAWRSRRPRLALACAVACGCLRVESWPFLLAAAVMAWRRRPEDRPLYLAAVVLVPAAWFVPEWLGSGDPLRSGTRARVPNPGQPALAELPFWASLRESVSLPPLAVWIGTGAALLTARRALIPAAVGLAWILLVAAMAQAGFSGEARYALPGAALLSITGAAGLLALARIAAGTLGAAALGAVAALILGAAAIAVPAAGRIADVRPSQQHQWRLQSDLAALIRSAGGRDALLACGRPYVGRLRGPLLAYHLKVQKRRVEPDDAPVPPGVVFRSRLRPGDRIEPAAAPGFEPAASRGTWELASSCATIRAP